MAIKKVLVPIDFSPYSEEAFRYAVKLAGELNASVDLLHVYEVMAFFQTDLLVIPTSGGNALPVRDALRLEASERLKAFVQSCRSKGLVAHATELIEGPPAATIAKFADEQGYDLIVMGTRGRTGAAKIFLGSVAQRVIEQASCPVMTVRRAKHDEGDQ